MSDKMSEVLIMLKIQKKMLLFCGSDLIVALIFRHFITESSYFTGWRGMQQRERLYCWKQIIICLINKLIEFCEFVINAFLFIL